MSARTEAKQRAATGAAAARTKAAQNGAEPLPAPLRHLISVYQNVVFAAAPGGSSSISGASRGSAYDARIKTPGDDQYKPARNLQAKMEADFSRWAARYHAALCATDEPKVEPRGWACANGHRRRSCAENANFCPTCGAGKPIPPIS